ncbi:MAG: hypothetical protein IKP49_03510 [Treponema sp.]|nr:hypothetical protein [Treponema sp.]
MLKIKNIIAIVLSSLFLTSLQFANESNQSHLKSVSAMSAIALKNGEHSVFSAGNDGFLIKWDDSDLGEHYQVSNLPVKFVAQNPNGKEIAVYETDGATFNRVSVWDWKNQRRKFSVNFDESVTSLSYSAKGTYVICGTVNGVYFVDENGNASASNIKDNVGTFSFTMTSASENNFVAYSPIGTLTYYDLKTGEKKYKFDVKSNLSNVRMFNKSVFLAGTKNDKIYVLHAVLKGKLLNEFNASNAVILSSADDSPVNSENLFYIVNDSRQFRLFKISNENGKNISAPQLARTFSGLKTGEKVVSGTISGDFIFAGTNMGNIYKFDYEEAERVDVLLPITENRYDTLLDICESTSDSSNDFYILSPQSIYKTNFSEGSFYKRHTNPGYTNILEYGNNLILWSKDTKKPVVKIDMSTGTSANIFSPTENIRTLKISGGYIIDVESNSTVNRYEISTGKKERLYQGAGVQDAVLVGNDLYVAKSSATNPNVPLLYINARTQETVPLNVPGTIAYALNIDEKTNKLYGILIDSEKNDKTSVFEFDIGTKAQRNLIQVREEDTEAFMFLSDGCLYTNVGKSNARSYNIRTDSNFLYRRSESMPLKVVKNKDRILVLNRNGSLNIYYEGLNMVKAILYLDFDGQWIEF